MRSNRKALLIAPVLLSLSFGCAKKDDDDDDDTAETTDGGSPGGPGVAGGTIAVTTVDIANPAGVLSLALDSFGSLDGAGLGKTLGSSGAAALTEGEDIFTPEDCDEHAQALARAGDDAMYKDDAGRLRISHPRSALQNTYCQITKDTGSSDSFLGTLSQAKMLLCIMGDGQVFDGVEREATRTYDDLVACLPPGVTDEEKKEMFGEDTSITLTVKVTGAQPPAFGDAAAWDASLLMVVEDFGPETFELRLLLRNSNGVVALASLAADGRPEPVNAYLVSLNASTGEAWLNSKFQRLRTPDGTSSNGWNRQTAAYVKGTMDTDLKFTDVTGVSLAYSDISAGNEYESVDDPLQTGSLFTVSGDRDTGILSYAYELQCTGESMGSYTCQDPNAVASWKALEGSGACNGALSGTTCTGSGIELTTDEQTVFAMHKDHAGYLKVEDWFAALAIPITGTVKLQNVQE